MRVSDSPHAPWRLRGEVVLAWAWTPRALRALVPPGLRPVAGPAAVVGVRYTDSPVGPYVEMSVAVPARLGLRPGLCVVAQVVSVPAASLGYRRNWGLPAEAATITWLADDDTREVRWEERGLSVRADPVGPRLPAFVPLRSVQRRADGPIVVPRRVAALARLARCIVTVDEDDTDLLALAGPHPGAILSAARLVAQPARRPAGVFSSLRAPLGAAEPAMFAGAGPGRHGRYSERPVSGAHSSVG